MEIDWKKVQEIIQRPQKGTARPKHFLRKTKHIPATPKRVIFFDSESIVTEKDHAHIPYVICATFVNYEQGRLKNYRYGSELARKQDQTLRPLESFWIDMIAFTKPKDLLWVMAHNCGYDLLATGGAKRLFELGYVPLGIPYEKGLTFIWEVARPNPEPRECGRVWESKKSKGICKEDSPCPKCRRKRRHTHNIRFVSTSNYYPQSLAALGRTFSLEKQAQTEDTKFDFSRLHEYDIKTVISYCERDVQIIVKAMEALFNACENGERTGFGSFRNTLPAMAFNAYQTWYMPDGEILCHDDPDVIKLERESYYGGRVEVWKRGKAPETVYGVDINSMYPFVMQEFHYPTAYISHRRRETVPGLAALLDKGYMVIARVTIKTNENAYPMRFKNKLIFPVGTFQTVITTPEIDYAIKRNHIIDVHEVAVYKSSPIFREFVSHFYHLREKHKPGGESPSPVWDLLYKLIMNSLYGKFGQLKREWEQIGKCSPDLVETEELIDVSGPAPVKMRFRKFGGRVYMEEITEDVAYNASVAIAAHVTAYARMLLWSYIQIAGTKNHYYNDTDSLYVNAAGLRRLEAAGKLHPTRLGYLALEKEASQAIFLGPKHYILDGHRKLKGISASARQLAENVFEQLQWPSFRSAMNTGNITWFANRQVVKQLSPEYSKGWVLKTGEVVPLQFTISEGENKPVGWEDLGHTLNELELEANMDKLPRREVK